MSKKIQSFVALTLLLMAQHVLALPNSEIAALEALYNQTGGANWNRNALWMGPQGTWCQWEGVSCDNNNAHIKTIVLNFNNLTGKIPEELSNLTELIELKLPGNLLTGKIPQELGELSQLSTLDLSLNQLSGKIPTKLGDLIKVTSINLADNMLSGSIPAKLSQLANLSRLYLSKNQLSGSIPTELGDFQRLSLLKLDNNQLTGNIPPQLGMLSFLGTLALENNELIGDVPLEIQQLASIFYFTIENNCLDVDPQLLVGSSWNIVSPQRVGCKVPLPAVGLPLITVLVNGTEVTVSWDAVDNAEEYTLFYAPFPYKGTKTIKSIDLGDVGSITAQLWNGASFYVALKAYNADSVSDYSNIELFTLN